MLRSVSAPSTLNNNGYDELADDDYYFSMQPENFDDFSGHLPQQMQPDDWKYEDGEEEEEDGYTSQDEFYFYPYGSDADDQVTY